MWMKTAHRDLNNYQWRLVANAISKCSLPIFVKLVFAEICRWRSYTKPADTHLTCTVMDSIMMLFERIEKQHGKILVFHALAYITAAKSGLSESELEDLISLDDKVLDDVYQYHLPPVRRIPPLLWTRIRNDLPNYLSEREADGVSVLNWYHRQFRDTAKERYFKNMNMAMYFHSMIADYYLGIWGGGRPKPFKYTEIQRHRWIILIFLFFQKKKILEDRDWWFDDSFQLYLLYRFNLTDKEGVADRKVPEQPLAFYSKEGTISRYNLRKVYHKWKCFVFFFWENKVNSNLNYSSANYPFTWSDRDVSTICSKMFCSITNGFMQNWVLVRYKLYFRISRTRTISSIIKTSLGNQSENIIIGNEERAKFLSISVAESWC